MNKYFIGNVTLCLLWENDGKTIFIDSLNGFPTAEKIEKISETFPNDHQNKVHKDLILDMLKSFYETKCVQKREVKNDQDADAVYLYPAAYLYDNSSVKRSVLKADKDNKLLIGEMLIESENIIWLPVFEKEIEDLFKQRVDSMIEKQK